MSDIGTTCWTSWTGGTFGTTASEKVACSGAVSSIFSNLAYAINGTLSAVNFQTLTKLFGSAPDGREWTHRAIKEAKIRFDPYDGHDHSSGARADWVDREIQKKNLRVENARVVWTNLEGFPAEQLPHGMTMIGGVQKIALTYDGTTHDLIKGFTPGSFGTTESIWYSHTNFIKWTDARYWKNAEWDATSTTAGGGAWTTNKISPFAPGVQPVVMANFLLPQFGATNATPRFLRWGRVGFEVGYPDLSNYYYGFWPYWTAFSFFTTCQSTGTFSLVIPWIAIGPGGYGWV